MSLYQICDYNLCTGCGVCAASCPKSSIQLKINSMGAIQPVINTASCVKCGICKKSCPIVNEKRLKFHSVIKTYYARTISNVIYSNASSGGIATQLALEVIKLGGCVYASIMENEKFKAKHMRIVDFETLTLSQKSKYVQSRIEPEIYNKILTDVKNRTLVLFIGTPCQVAGVKNYLKKEEDNIIYIELICHGIPGEQVFCEYLKMEDLLRDNIANLQFRNKKDYCITYEYKTNDHRRNIPLTPKTSLYYHGFMSGSISRQSCHLCRFARRTRVGDITLGDTEYLADGEVYSSVIIYTKRGLDFFDRILKELKVKEVDPTKMLDSHAQLNGPVSVNEEQRKFKNYCETRGIQYALKNMNRKKTVLIAIRRSMYKCKWAWNIVRKIPYIKKIFEY